MIDASSLWMRSEPAVPNFKGSISVSLRLDEMGELPSIDSPGVDQNRKHVSFASATPNKTTSANAPSPSKVLPLPEGERRVIAKEGETRKVVTLPGLRGLPKSSSARLVSIFRGNSLVTKEENKPEETPEEKQNSPELALAEDPSQALQRRRKEEDYEENANGDEGKEHDQRIRSMSKQAHTRISSIWHASKKRPRWRPLPPGATPEQVRRAFEAYTRPDRNELLHGTTEEAYKPQLWLAAELSWRRGGSGAGGEVYSEHEPFANMMWRCVNRFKATLSEPAYAGKDPTAARALLADVGMLETLAPAHFATDDYFQCVLFAYYGFNAFAMHKMVSSLFAAFLDERVPKSRVLARKRLKMQYKNMWTEVPYPDRIDCRRVVCCLRIAQNALVARENIEFCLHVHEQGSTGRVLLSDFIAILALPAQTASDCQLALAVRDALVCRERDSLERRHNALAAALREVEGELVDGGDSPETFRRYLALEEDLLKEKEEQKKKAQASVGGEGELQKTMAIAAVLQFLAENPLIELEFQEQSMRCLSPSVRAAVIAEQATLCEKRFAEGETRLRMKKALYHWRYSTLDTCMRHWRAVSVTGMIVRANCAKAEAWRAAKDRREGVAQWCQWLKKRRREKKEEEAALSSYRHLVFVHMFRRWKHEYLLQKRLRQMRAGQRRAEYVHALKATIRVFHKIVTMKSRSGFIFMFHKWETVTREERTFESAIRFDVLRRLRLPFVRWRQFVVDEHHRRYVLMLETEARQDQIRRDAEAAQRQAEEEVRREEEERARRRAEEERKRKEKEDYEEEFKARAREVDRLRNNQLLLDMQKERRVLAREKQRRELRVKFDKKWDMIEASMCDKCRAREMDYIVSASGENKLKRIAFDIRESVSSSITTRKERLEWIARMDEYENRDTPREGLTDWQLIYSRLDNSKHWENRRTGEKQYAEFLTKLTKVPKAKVDEMASNLYADRKVIEQRKKCMEMRRKAWEKELRVLAAAQLNRWWRMTIARRDLKQYQWKAQLRMLRANKNQQPGAARTIQRAWKRRSAQLRIHRMVDLLVQRYETEDGTPYWYDAKTGETSWTPPTRLAALVEEDRQRIRVLRAGRSERVEKKKRLARYKKHARERGGRSGSALSQAF
eukprot:g5031.t1